MDTIMKKMVEEHQATVRKMVEEQKAAMARIKQKHPEALESFQNETLQNYSNFLLKLKANIFLHVQVVGGPFDARKVDLDAIYKVVVDQLGFEIHFHSRATWEKFTSK
ncbi:hypothetical protein PVK06_017284 [Gossypium arboreum]|uniref:Uncharacterized protein n=1 Tax=Gossypium arboreum TaxID=29729 RepID=A0ABR0Q2S3_GOSAR|nr:hypothetical protein PVK06_017284 [Gossypium arboreum]